MCTVNDKIKVIEMLLEGVGFQVKNRRRNFRTTGIKMFSISEISPKGRYSGNMCEKPKKESHERGCY